MVSKQIAFVDTAVADYQTLVAALDPGVEVVLLAAAGALQQMADALAGRSGLDAIHVISHGSAGQLWLGDTMLESGTLAQHAEQLAAVGAALGAEGDLLLHGCEIGAGAPGASLVAALAAATGADVAASDDLTGAAERGGDWELEIRSGVIEAEPAFSKTALADFSGLLAAADGTKTFAIFTDAGDTLTNTDFVVSAMEGNGTLQDAAIYAGGVAYFQFGASPANNYFYVAADGVNTTAFELTGLAAGEYLTGKFTNVRIEGVLAAGGTITSSTINGSATISGESFNFGAGELANFEGQKLKGFKLFFDLDGAQGTNPLPNFEFRSFTIQGAIDTPPAPPAPVVSDARIQISGASGTAGVFRVGDIVTATWDNSALGDNNAELTGVTVDFSQFGGGTAVAASQSGGIWTASYTIATGSIDATDRNVSVTATNAGGSTTTADTTNALVDNIRPGATTIAPSAASPTNADTLAFSVTFSEAVTGVGADDFKLAGAGALGTIASVSGSGTSYTVNVAQVEGDGTLRLDLNASGTGIVDDAGNAIGAGFTGASAIIDNTAPAAPAAPDLHVDSDSGTSTSDNLTSATTLAIGGSADWNERIDLYADGKLVGTATAVEGSWQITTSALAEGVHTLTATATDTAGNVSAASAPLTVTVDTTAPTLAITSDTPSLKAGDKATLTFEFSEDPGGTFTLADIKAQGGTLEALSGSGLSRTAIFTPDAGFDGTAKVVATGSGFTDAAGNLGAADAELLLAVDNVPPAAPGALDLDTASDKGTSTSDNITSVTTPKVGGTAEAGTTVVLYDTDGSTELGSTKADGAGNWSITSLALADGVHTLTAKSFDPAGNASGASASLAVTIDTSAPTTTVPTAQLSHDTGTGGFDFLTAVAGQTISGTTDPALAHGEIVQVSLDDGATWATATIAEGETAWSFDATLAGTNVLRVRVSDAAGNAGTEFSQSYELDTAAPEAPSVPMLAAGRDSGSSASDGITNATTLTLSGTAEAGSWVVLYQDGKPFTSGAADKAGHWSFTTTALPEGTHVVTADARDKAGNASAASAGLTLVVDVTAPVAPTGLALLAASDTGSSDGDGITTDTTPTLSGTAEAGSLVRLYDTDGTTLLGEATADGAGHWSITCDTPLGDGGHQLRAGATDLAGNVSELSEQLAITIDTQAALAPVPGLAVDSGHGDDRLTSDGTVTVTGLEEGASWEFSLDDGKWMQGVGSSVTVNGDGVRALAVRQTDAAGNTSLEGTLTFTLDTGAAAPGLALALDSGASDADAISRHGTIAVSGLEDGASWEYSVDGGVDWTAGKGSSFVLAEGSYAAAAVRVRQTDAAGNASAEGLHAAEITIDASASAPGLALHEDSGSSGSDGTTSNGTVTVDGLEDGASWQYSTDGGDQWQDGSGASFTLAAGSYAAGVVQVRQTDLAGNLGAATSNAAAITVDTKAAAPTIALAGDSGSSGSDAVTNSGTVNVTGLEASASWQYSLDKGTSWMAGSGTSLELAGDGVHVVSVRQTDLAGNVSAASAPLTFTLDTDAAAPTLALNFDSGASGGDGITSSGRVDVEGLEAGASWEYSTDGGTTWSAGIGSSFTLAGDGVHSVQVRQTDLAGNTSDASGALLLTLDTTAPAPAPAASRPADDATAAPVTGAVVLAFDEPLDAASDPAQVRLWHTASNTQVAATVTIGEAGELVVRPAQALQYGSDYHLTWEAGALRDAAGNAAAANDGATAYNFRTMAEPPPETPPGTTTTTIDGVEVQTQVSGTTRTVTIPVVTGGRRETIGDNSVADIPLVQDGTGAPLLTAQVPTGLGMQVSGAVGAQTVAGSLTTLIRAIQAHTPDGSGDQLALTSGGGGFLRTLATDATLLVQTVVLQSSGSTAGEPLVLTGRPAAPGVPATALVIDASALPPGTVLQLQDVAFAAIIGNVRVAGGAGAQTAFGDSSAQYIVLGAGDDELHGGGGDDTVGSEGGNDRLFGDAGDDLLFGGAGQDLIAGGSGHDTVTYAGAQADYAIERNGKIVTVRSLADATDADTLVNVESLRFADATVSLAVDAAPATMPQLIAGLYAALYDRAPDLEGLQYWIDRAAGEQLAIRDVATLFATHAKFSELYAPGQSTADFVASVYQNVLGIEGDAAGRAFWAQWIDAGLGRTDFVGEFVMASLNFDAGTSSATGADLANATRAHDTLTNKVEVGLHFAAALAAKSNGAVDSTAYQQSEQVLAGIDAGAASLEAAVVQIDLIGGHSGFGSAVAQGAVFG